MGKATAVPKTASRIINNLEFDEAAHQYKYRGKPLASVTGVIGQFKRVKLGELKYIVDVFSGTIFDAEIFDKPAEVGSALHHGCALLLKGKRLKWDKLDPLLVEPLRRFEEWMQEVCPVPVLIEQPMASAKFMFAGTPDMIVDLFGGKGTRYLIDIKTGAAGMAGPQTAAYEKMYREMYGWTGKLKRAVLELPKDGSKYKLKVQKGADDWEFFKARLTQHNFLK